MFIDKIVELYREACVHGLPVSLSLSHLNGRESFSFTSIPGPDLAGRPERRRRPRGGRRRRGRGNHGASADQPADAVPSYATVARSQPSPLVSQTAKRPRRNLPGQHVQLRTPMPPPAPPPPTLLTPTPPTLLTPTPPTLLMPTPPPTSPYRWCTPSHSRCHRCLPDRFRCRHLSCHGACRHQSAPWRLIQRRC